MLVIGTALFCYRHHVNEILNSFFLSLFGKDLSGRNLMIRGAVIGSVICLCLGAGLFFNHFDLSKGPTNLY